MGGLGYKIVSFLDDGLGGANTFLLAVNISQFIHNDLLDFGFLISEYKCHLTPAQCIVWLGYIWNTIDGTHKVKDERIDR